MLRTYKFKEGKEKIRLLPYLDKDGNFKKSFHIIQQYSIFTRNCLQIQFYIKDDILNDALININPSRSSKLLRNKMVYFYALVNGKVELISFKFSIFEPIYYKLSKLIHEGKDPFDPMNGIGIMVDNSRIRGFNHPMLKLCEVDPISYATNLESLKSFLLNREVHLSDIEDYELNKHENKKRIHEFMDSFKPLKDVKWKIRQERLRKIKNNITHQNST